MASVYESKEPFSRKKIPITGSKDMRSTEVSSIDIHNIVCSGYDIKR